MRFLIKLKISYTYVLIDGLSGKLLLGRILK